MSKNKYFIYPLIILALFAIWVLYKVFGHDLIASMYNGQSFSFLNNLIQGQETSSQEIYFSLADDYINNIIISLLISITSLWVLLRPKVIINYIERKKWLISNYSFIESIPIKKINYWIALASGCGLFTELMIIRLHASYFQLFAYFKNISLLSCFLGLGIGYALNRKNSLLTPLVIPLLTIQILILYILRFSSFKFYLHTPITEELFLGIHKIGQLDHILIVYGFLMIIFTFNALCFIPIGHLISCLMSRQNNLVAYSWNLIGSLIGIILFSILSYFWTPPVVWVSVSFLMLLLFYYKENNKFIISIILYLILIISLSIPIKIDEIDIYSPYQILTLKLSPNDSPTIKTSNAYYQRILNMQNYPNSFYNLPYRFKPKPNKVLIVGAGTGNDVAAAERNHSGQIDAVEIDPAIMRYGKLLHPERPYQSTRVNNIVQDARIFIRQTNKMYDLIIYGLLDSHTLLSGRSGGIRLDSYIYTVEGFRDARKKLNDDGLLCLTFSIMSNNMGNKLYLMLKEAFDDIKPIVINANYDGGYTFIVGNGIEDMDLENIAETYQITNKFADNNLQADLSTDDWPFFYMPFRTYPHSYILLLSVLSILSFYYIKNLVSTTKTSFSLPAFFLGAGFMLIETKGITELSLYYGSTWVVISIVIFSVLIMAFFANYTVMKIKNISSFFIYSTLLLSLLLGIAITYGNLSDYPNWIGMIIMPVFLTLPLFFSGLAFSQEVKKTMSISVILYSNLIGAMLGGFLEYNVMYFGFRSLYILAIFMYIMAYLTSRKVIEPKSIII